MPSWLDRGAELAGYPWATGAEMACCTLLQILPRYNKVPSWRPPNIEVPKKEDESITPLFIRGFQLFIHQIKWL
jgi:hypothetical protein